MASYLTPEPVIVEVRNASGNVTVDLSATVTTSTVTIDHQPGVGGLLGDLVAGFRNNQSSGDPRRTGPAPADEARVDLRMVETGANVLIVDTDPARSGRRSAFDVVVTAPLGSGVRVQTQSADIRVLGRADRLDLRTASGDVSVATVEGSSLVQTASGSIRVDELCADAEFRTASGDVVLGRTAGSVSVQATSGDVRLSEPAGDVFIRNVSGDVEVEAVGAGTVEATTVSGDVSVGVLPGSIARFELHTISGSTRNDFDVHQQEPELAPEEKEPRRLSVACRSRSGDVRLRRISGVRS